MEDMFDEVSVSLRQLTQPQLISVCKHLGCPTPSKGIFSDMTRRSLFKIVEATMEDMEENKSFDIMSECLKDLLKFIREMGEADDTREIEEVDEELAQRGPDQSRPTKSVDQCKQLQQDVERLTARLTPHTLSSQDIRQSSPYRTLPEVTLRREFKINGQIGEGGQKDKLSYTSLVHQIDAGLRKGHSEPEIIEAVIRAVSPGLHLRDMLEIKSDLNLSSLKIILKGHYKEESAADIYNRLVNISQEPKEAAQTFLFRAIELKERLLWKSSEGDDGDYYSPNLVQRKFLRAIETGLLSDAVKFQVKTHLSDIDVTDETLIEKVSEAASVEGERQKKLKKSAPMKGAHMCEIQTEVTSPATPQEKQSRTKTKVSEPHYKTVQAPDLQAQKVLEELKADVNEMRDFFLANIEAAKHQPQRERATFQPPAFQPTTFHPHAPRPMMYQSSAYQPAARGRPMPGQRPRGCASCQQAQRGDHCDHCFRCGESGHISRGCRKPRQMGNENGLLRGDQQ